MTAQHEERRRPKALLVHYSPEARRWMATVLEGKGFETYSVDGRAPDAMAQLQAHSAHVVVMDGGARDVSVTQAVRRVCQVLPSSLVITLLEASQPVDLYVAGRRIGREESLEAAINDFDLAT